MIAFSCAQCGMKFNVKPEFAGRSSRCPGCKQPLVVPAEETAGQVPQGEIDGTASSLARAGVDVSVSLPRRGEKSPSAPGQSKGQRYAVRSEIARGGMGAVVSAFDCDIRREVAIKFMLDQSDARKRARFVEEAQITGQLEHPNIVPIHELGVDAKKRLFFSMKMVQGRSLKEIVEQLRDNPKQAEKEYGLGRRLTILVGICNALAYAHARGVVHRDLKPANIMVGDFGEVYVMDWGLAKVLSQEAGGKRTEPAGTDSVEGFVKFMGGKPENVTDGLSAQSRVSTSGREEADLTQEGSILGTPVYMAPEQAMGEISAIDQRSDIYSLGAILYELLTLQPPIEKDGGYMAIQRRVSKGEIKPPEARAPKRFIPRELSAIAMKALALDKEVRYQSAEEFRDDINRYLEGRSVSAKEDTRTEMLVKFVKRNKGFSAASGVSMVVLSIVLALSFHYNNQARLRAESARAQAEENYQAYRDEQTDKEKRTREAVPALLDATRMAVLNNQIDNARTQAALAIDYAPDNAEARLLLGQILVAREQYEDARPHLERYSKLRPKDVDAATMLRLSATAKPADAGSRNVLAELLLKQGHPALAGTLARSGEKKKLQIIYQAQLDKAWPGLGSRVLLDKDSRLILLVGAQVSDLTPIQGMQLNTVEAHNTRVRDLSPLKGMPLTRLHPPSGVSDLTPLKGMPLTYLNLARCPVNDLTPLKGMPLASLDLGECLVSDLTPLKGMPLTYLNLARCPVNDLTPLKGMPLASLNLGECLVSDLTPLKGMPLTSLKLIQCPVSDLTPLKGMPLTSLRLDSCRSVTDLSPLKGMPLTTLFLTHCQLVTDLSPLRGMPLTTLPLYGCGASDLTPLEGMKLGSIILPAKATGMDVLRRMKSLGSIHAMPVADFWKDFDAGKYPQYKP